MNKKGFVLAETLVVTIFVLLIFTILYNSAVPLLGRYQQISYYNDIDSTYDLYHIRNLLRKDTNFDAINNAITDTNNLNEYGFAILKCSKNDLDNQNRVKTFANFTECNNLFSAIGIENSTNMDIKDELIYLIKDGVNSAKNSSLISEQIRDYLDYADLPSYALILQNDGKISYIDVNPDVSINAPKIDFVVTGTSFGTGYRKGAKVRMTCSYPSGLSSFSTTINGFSDGSTISSSNTSNVREITMSNSGTVTLKAVCKGTDNKEISKTMTYAIYD